MSDVNTLTDRQIELATAYNMGIEDVRAIIKSEADSASWSDMGGGYKVAAERLVEATLNLIDAKAKALRKMDGSSVSA